MARVSHTRVTRDDVHCGSGTRVNINKHALAAKLVFQILTDAQRVSARVVTAIAYENLLRHLECGPRGP
jgi:hypothetical protein